MKLTTKQRSKFSENRAAKVYGGRVQIASGALQHSKGDVITPKLLIEDKTTAAKRYILEQAKLTKLRREALQHRRMPAFRITFESTRESYLVLTEEDARLLIEVYQQENGTSDQT